METKQTPAQTIKELITTYDTMRAQWIEANGSDKNFNSWFWNQISNGLDKAEAQK